jgi:hypothetical protein
MENFQTIWTVVPVKPLESPVEKKTPSRFGPKVSLEALTCVKAPRLLDAIKTE